MKNRILATLGWVALGIAVLALVAYAALGQTCSQVVVDDAHVLSAPQTAQIQTEASKLINEGADLHVVTAGPTDNLDMVEKTYERNCAGWQSPNGGRKSTLLVLMVSPTSRKLGLYYGAGLAPALDGHWNRIKSDYMVPSFRVGDWAQGFINTEQHLASRLLAAKDESVHPAVTTVTQQATDLHGLWAVMGWIVGILGIAFAIWGIALLVRRKNAIGAAQQLAILRRSQCISLIHSLQDDTTVNGDLKLRLDQAVERYAELAGSERTNPDTPGLTAGEYENIGQLYSEIRATLLTGYTFPKNTETPDIPHTHHHKAKTATASASTDARPIESGSTSIFAPVIINSETTNEPSHDRPTEHETSRMDSEGGSSAFTSGGGSDDSSSGGGSSSYSSDSSSYDSGGSSSFDSGSSGGGFDSGGGGGGSDF